jgi:hypothetical protein
MHHRPETGLGRHQERRPAPVGGSRIRPLITSDQNIRYQQNLAGYSISILELSTNDLRRLRAGAAQIQATVAAMQPGELRHLDIP